MSGAIAFQGVPGAYSDLANAGYRVLAIARFPDALHIPLGKPVPLSAGLSHRCITRLGERTPQRQAQGCEWHSKRARA